MTLRRNLVYLLAAAIPTLLLIAIAAYLLLRFLAVRDRLGIWDLSVHDAHGVEVGHGVLILLANRWTVHWSWSPPFADFDPTLGNVVGTLTLDPTDPVLACWAASDHCHDLVSAQFFERNYDTVCVTTAVDAKASLGILVDLVPGPPHSDPIWLCRPGRNTTPVPLTIHASRVP